MRPKFEPTRKQAQTLAGLRRLFAEHGYDICPVDRRHQYHEQAFVAVRCPSVIHPLLNFVIVYPLPSGRVTIRTYHNGIFFREIRNAITTSRRSITSKVVWNRRPLPDHQQAYPWMEYLEPKVRKLYQEQLMAA